MTKERFAIPLELRGRVVTLEGPMNCHPDRSEPGFPATQHWTQPRVRLSVKKGA